MGAGGSREDSGRNSARESCSPNHSRLFQKLISRMRHVPIRCRFASTVGGAETGYLKRGSTSAPNRSSERRALAGSSPGRRGEPFAVELGLVHERVARVAPRLFFAVGDVNHAAVDDAEARRVLAGGL